MIRVCEYAACGKEFVVTHGGQLYCSALCRIRNKEVHRPDRTAYRKEYYNRNKEHNINRSMLWCENHYEEYRVIRRTYEHNRRTRLTGAGGTHTEEQFMHLVREHKWRCHYCRRYMVKTKDNTNDRQLTKDHIVAVSNYGTNDISNIVPCCRRCNNRKGNRS